MPSAGGPPPAGPRAQGPGAARRYTGRIEIGMDVAASEFYLVRPAGPSPAAAQPVYRRSAISLLYCTFSTPLYTAAPQLV